MGKLTEKSDPIPPGVYWVDIIDRQISKPKNLAAWNAWAMKVAPRVKVLKKERHVTGDFFDLVRGQRVWTLFRVTAPVPRWPKSVAVGFPTHARKGASTKAADTVQRRPEQGTLSYWSENAPSATAGFGLALLLGVYLLTRK